MTILEVFKSSNILLLYHVKTFLESVNYIILVHSTDIMVVFLAVRQKNVSGKKKSSDKFPWSDRSWGLAFGLPLVWWLVPRLWDPMDSCSLAELSDLSVMSNECKQRSFIRCGVLRRGEYYFWSLSNPIRQSFCQAKTDSKDLNPGAFILVQGTAIQSSLGGGWYPQSLHRSSEALQYSGRPEAKLFENPVFKNHITLI